MGRRDQIVAIPRIPMASPLPVAGDMPFEKATSPPVGVPNMPLENARDVDTDPIQVNNNIQAASSIFSIAPWQSVSVAIESSKTRAHVQALVALSNTLKDHG